MRRGYIQVYTGTGKGKTTAALGLALRAAGAGLRVYIAQFIKKRTCSEHRIINDRLKDLITVRQFGKGLILKREITQQDIKAAQKGLAEIRTAMESDDYDMVILDEANVAVRYSLIQLIDLLDIMEKKPERVELIITGRYAHEKVIEKADLATEMKEIKHYREKGIKARRGIEC
jgi:cob(I)alamin adenosyltransferase